MRVAGRALLATSRTAAMLVRWGTQLHDRFMLPHFVWQDFEDVLDDMNRAGYRARASWFAPHFEFRFPRYGSVGYGGVEIELRQALEPWHVLGEEGAVGGTARYVDSSVERDAGEGERHDRGPLSCSPATAGACRCIATGRAAEFVGGVRYRAWQPASMPAPHDPRTRAARVRSLRSLVRSRGRAAARITSRIRAAAVSSISQSTLMRRRAGASRASSRSAIPPVLIKSLSRSRGRVPVHARSALVALR